MKGQQEVRCITAGETKASYMVHSYSVQVYVIRVQLRQDQWVFNVAPIRAEASSHPTKDRNFTKISGASNYKSEKEMSKGR